MLKDNTIEQDFRLAKDGGGKGPKPEEKKVKVIPEGKRGRDKPKYDIDSSKDYAEKYGGKSRKPGGERQDGKRGGPGDPENM